MRRHVFIETSALTTGVTLLIASFASAGEARGPLSAAAKTDSIGVSASEQSASNSAPDARPSESESSPPSKIVEAPDVLPAPNAEPTTTAAKHEEGAATRIKTSGTVAAKPVDDPALPARIPGYELRVLDVRKDVFFHVNGTWLQTAIPIYFYFPTPNSERMRSLELLRQARDEARKLSEVSTEKTPELDRVVANLEAALGVLDKVPTP